MKVAVTGGSGQIGSHVVRRFAEAGHEVLILDKRAPRERLGRFIFIDLRDRQFLQPVLEGCDAVLHLGEIPNAGAGESPHDVYVRNTAAGSTVLQTCFDLKIPRVIYTSSAQVYGLWGGEPDASQITLAKVPMDETQPLLPTNPYALAKVANEGFAQILGKAGMSVATFRFPRVVDARFGGRWVRWMTSHPDWYKESFDGYGSFLDSRDAADAYLLAVEKPRPGYEAYHLVAPDVLGTAPIRERLDAWGIPQSILPPDWPSHAVPISCEKARSHFGWEAKRTSEALFAEFAANSR